MIGGMIRDQVNGTGSGSTSGLLELEGSTDLITLEDGTSGIIVNFIAPFAANYPAQEANPEDLILLEDGGFIIVN